MLNQLETKAKERITAVCLNTGAIYSFTSLTDRSIYKKGDSVCFLVFVLSFQADEKISINFK